jgi:hypothetical protein
MRRATALLVAACLGLAVLLAAPPIPAAVKSLDSSMMVDYSGRPGFQVGSWVRYRVTSRSKLGVAEDYYITMLIGGEEDFWGDPGFWLETWVTNDAGDTSATASMVSYSAFGDTAAARHLTWFLRKMVTGQHGPGGGAEVTVWTRDGNEIRQRAKDQPRDLITARGTTFDTLGVDTTVVPRGSFKGKVVRERTAIIAEQMKGDSTYRYQREEIRTRKMSDEVPITHMVREDVVDTQTRKGWITGHSGESEEEVLERGVMATILVGYGVGEIAPGVTPARVRMSLAEQRAKAASSLPVRRTKRGG